jgi:hypothetical protein
VNISGDVRGGDHVLFQANAAGVNGGAVSLPFYPAKIQSMSNKSLIPNKLKAD